MTSSLSRGIAPSSQPLTWLAMLGLCCSLGACGSDSDGGSANPGSAGAGGSSAGSAAGGSSAGSAAGGSAAGGSGGSAGDTGSGGSGGSAGGSGAVCPPSAPFGSQVGDRASDVELFDCDGNPVRLHSLCEEEVSLVYTFAAWCPVCRSHMESGKPNQLITEYAARGFSHWVVVTQKADGSPADAELCRLTKEQYSLTPRVLFDPSDSLRAAHGVQVNSGSLVLSQGSLIEFKAGYNFGSVETKLAELIGD